MSKSISIRQQTAEILTDLLSNEYNGVAFRPEGTTKRSGGGKKTSKKILKISESWSARSEGDESILVCCFGMTMTEFIKDYKNNNVIVTRSMELGSPIIEIFRNKPEWETVGYVHGIDLENNKICLYLADMIIQNEIETAIVKTTPKWLIDAPPHLSAVFFCKIYQGMRAMKSCEGFDWSKIWRTFKFDRYLPKEELRDFFLSSQR